MPELGEQMRHEMLVQFLVVNVSRVGNIITEKRLVDEWSD